MPAWAPAGFATVLLTGVALVVVGALAQHYRRAARSAAAAGVVMLALDLTVLSYADAAGLLTTWPVLLAAALSAGRSVFILSRLPRIVGACR